MAERRYSDLILYRRAFDLMRPFRLPLTGIFFLALLSTPLTLLTPLPLKIAIDSIIGSQPLPGFLHVFLPAALDSDIAPLILTIGLVIGIATLVHLHSFSIWLLSSYTGEKLILRMRSRLFQHMQLLSPSYFDSHSTADSIYLVHHDAPCIKHIPIDGLIPLIRAVVTLLAMVYVTARLDWQLALVALAVAPIIFVLTSACGRRLRTKWAEVKATESTAMRSSRKASGPTAWSKPMARKVMSSSVSTGRRVVAGAGTTN